MKADYYIEVENWAKDLATRYHRDMDLLEPKKRNSRCDHEHLREIDQQIDSRKQQLLRDLKGNTTHASEILASGVVDCVTTWWLADLPRKQDVRNLYMQVGTALNKEDGEDAFAWPDFLDFEWPSGWMPNWFGIDVSFTLASPWYSKDDRPFHVLDNPVRKDRVFGVPFMSAASWKGLLRWACRMQAGLSDHLEKHDMKMDGWKDPSWIVHLFGNEKGEDKDFRSGTLACYPTWFNKVSFEVINPHSRRRRAGTQPIYYEVVPAGTKGRLRLLYAPLPGEIENDKVTPADCINSFIDFIGSIRELLETYGISAKRTAGWGTAKINNGDSKVWFLEGSWIAELIDKSAEKGKEEPPPEEFRKLLDENGSPIKILLDGNGKLLSKTQFRKLKVEKPCTSSEFEKFKDWYNEHGSEYSGRQRSNTENMPSIQIRELPFDKFKDARNRPRDARNGGDK